MVARRGGFAVAAVLLLLIGLTALAHGALVLAERERITSALEARLSARRLLARSAARVPESPDTLPRAGSAPAPIAAGSAPPLRWATESRALDRELHLLIGVGRADGLPGAHRVAVLAFALDPSARLAAARAVVETGGGVQGPIAAIASAAWLAPPEPAATWRCAPELRALDPLDARPPPAFAPFTAAHPADTSGIPALGVLPGDSALARLPDRVDGFVAPAPQIRAGECVDAPTNWGSPRDPTGPCGGRAVAVGAEGDVVLGGGEGQGVLVARGVVRLAAGARFDGLVLAGGDLVVERGAELVGAARVRGAVRLEGGSVRGSACAAALALRSATRLRRPLLLPAMGRIYPF